MEFITTIVVLIVFGVFSYYYPKTALKIGFIGGVLIVTIIIMAPLLFGSLFSSIVSIGHESFYTALFIAGVTVVSGHGFAQIIASVGKRKLLIITAGIVTLALSLGAFRFGYQWEVSDALSKSCETCTDFNSGNLYTYNPSGATTQACIVWDNPQATAQCLYPSTLPQPIFYSVFLALISMGLAFFYTQEIEIEIE